MRLWTIAAMLPGLRVPLPPEDVVHAAYKCYVFVDPDRLRAGWSRDRILAAIQDRGVPCYTGSCSEIYRERAFDGIARVSPSDLPNSQALGRDALMFLVHPTLRDEEIERCCDALTDVMLQAAVTTHDAHTRA